MISEIFRSLLESDARRTVRDGLTTQLAKAAKAQDYLFVVHSQAQAQLIQKTIGVDCTTSHNIRALQGHKGYLWDHFAIHIACLEMQKSHDLCHRQLELANKYVAKAWNETYLKELQELK